MIGRSATLERAPSTNLGEAGWKKEGALSAPSFFCPQLYRGCFEAGREVAPFFAAVFVVAFEVEAFAFFAVDRRGAAFAFPLTTSDWPGMISAFFSPFRRMMSFTVVLYFFAMVLRFSPRFTM